MSLTNQNDFSQVDEIFSQLNQEQLYVISLLITEFQLLQRRIKLSEVAIISLNRRIEKVERKLSQERTK